MFRSPVPILLTEKPPTSTMVLPTALIWPSRTSLVTLLVVPPGSPSTTVVVSAGVKSSTVASASFLMVPRLLMYVLFLFCRWCRSAPRECSSGMSRTVSPDVPGLTTTTPSSLLPEPWTLSLSARSPRSTLLMMTSSTPLPMKPTSSKSCLLFAVYFFSTS